MEWMAHAEAPTIGSFEDAVLPLMEGLPSSAVSWRSGPPCIGATWTVETDRVDLPEAIRVALAQWNELLSEVGVKIDEYRDSTLQIRRYTPDDAVGIAALSG